MARPKEFDRSDALEKAVQLFWLQGFESTTMSDLQQTLGIGRQSLYDTFGSREKIFQEALQHYIAWANGRNAELLEADNGLEAVRNFFELNIDGLSGPGPRRACMMFNTSVEVAPHDPEIAKTVGEGIKDLQNALAAALERAKAQGDLSVDADVKSLAMYLASQQAGLGVMSQAGASRTDMRAVAYIALDALNCRDSQHARESGI
jgi:TetR/AcrR family transcriptional repressor of nem operon